jgi:CRP-like cAMP-binding protein
LSLNTSTPMSGISSERVSRAASSAAEAARPLSAFDRASLRQTPLLAALSAASFERLLPAFQILTTGRDCPVFSQGEGPDGLYVLLDGRVALMGQTSDHRTCILVILRSDEGLLDPSALIGSPHPVAARTIDSCRIAHLPEAALRELVDSEDGLCRGAVAALVQHWRLFLRRLEDQKLRSAPQRLASYLAECALNANPAARRLGQVRFILAEDRRTLASHLGMTPENLSRVIGQLRQQGVEFQGRAVTIADLSALRHFGCAAEA